MKEESVLFLVEFEKEAVRQGWEQHIRKSAADISAEDFEYLAGLGIKTAEQFDVERAIEHGVSIDDELAKLACSCAAEQNVERALGILEVGAVDRKGAGGISGAHGALILDDASYCAGSTQRARGRDEQVGSWSGNGRVAERGPGHQDDRAVVAKIAADINAGADERHGAGVHDGAAGGSAESGEKIVKQ